jgi:hypothetical protein
MQKDVKIVLFRVACSKKSESGVNKKDKEIFIEYG